MATKTLSPLPKPRTLLGWGMLAAATALVKEKYTDLTWGEVARAPIQGILNAYNDPQVSGWRKAWNVAVEGAKLGVGIALMAGATALATAAAPAVAATIAGGVALATGGLVVGGLASHFIADPLLDRAKSKPPEHKADTTLNSSPAPSYAAMIDERAQLELAHREPEATILHTRTTTASMTKSVHTPAALS